MFSGSVIKWWAITDCSPNINWNNYKKREGEKKWINKINIRKYANACGVLHLRSRMHCDVSIWKAVNLEASQQGGRGRRERPFQYFNFFLRPLHLELSLPHKRRYWCGGRARLCVLVQPNWPRKRVFHRTQFKMQMSARLVQQVFHWHCETFVSTQTALLSSSNSCWQQIPKES